MTLSSRHAIPLQLLGHLLRSFNRIQVAGATLELSLEHPQRPDCHLPIIFSKVSVPLGHEQPEVISKKPTTSLYFSRCDGAARAEPLEWAGLSGRARTAPL